MDEFVLAAADQLERAIEAPLETDCRGSLRAHACTAERACHVAGIELDAVRQLEQPLQASVQAVRALDGLGGEIGTRRLADEERVAGDHEPRLVAARAVDDDEEAVLRSVAPA